MLLAFFASLGTAGFATLSVTDLRCEYAANPLGIDTTQPRLSWRIESAERGQRQTAYQILAASDPALLAAAQADLWDSGRVETDRSLVIPYVGNPLSSSQQVHWQVRAWDRDGNPSPWSAPATWTMGLLKPTDWRGVWITSPATSEALLIRGEFHVKPGLRRAIAHVCGLGQYELFLNGAKAGDDVLAPGWTDYDETTLYDTRDITALVRPGRNAAGIALGNGMYHVVRRHRFSKFVGSFGPLRAILQVRLEYADGSVEFAGTGSDWRTHPGPLTFSSIYGGEDFDARLVPSGWKLPGFDDRAWPAAVLINRPADTLRGHSRAAEPVMPIETRPPASVRDLAPGVQLYDFGQNTSFMPRIRVSGPAGSTVRLEAGELLQPDGRIERSSMGGAHRGSAWWQYTKATDSPEDWFPQFYYVGSRYLYCELLPATATAGGPRPKLDAVEMVIVHSAAAPAGQINTSDPTLNRVRDLVRWAQRSNMVSLLTDCPHREKLGWLEQTHLNGHALRYEWDLARLFAKMTHDMADAQTDDGLIPNIAPEYTTFRGTFRAAAEWGAAFIMVPWQQYLFTGDTALLREYFPAMQRYFAYLEGKTQDGLLSEGLGDWYDHIEGKSGRANLTPPVFTATAFFYQDAVTLSQIAAVLGREADARDYAARAARIRERFNREFWKPGTPELYGTGSQTCLALPLAMGLVDPAHRDIVFAALVRDLEARGHATSGAAGFRYLLVALAEGGRSDLIHRFVTRDDKPGYAYQLKLGNTALAESWNAGRGASQNHFFLGQVTEWLYRYVAGIDLDPAAPGFKRVIIRPEIVPGLDHAEATYDSVHGPISIRWERVAGDLKLDVTLPANTTGRVLLPTSNPATVQESGRPAGTSPGVTPAGTEAGRAVFEVGSGRYIFSASLPGA